MDIAASYKIVNIEDFELRNSEVVVTTSQERFRATASIAKAIWRTICVAKIGIRTC